jgi:hypothetical protein
LKIFYEKKRKLCSGESRAIHTMDVLLIQLWLNISKDPIVRVDLKIDNFCLKITTNYITSIVGSGERSKPNQLKSQ